MKKYLPKNIPVPYNWNIILYASAGCFYHISHFVRSLIVISQIQHRCIWKCHCQCFMNDFTFIQSYLGIISEQSDYYPPIWQTAFTFQMIFLLFLSIYDEISVYYSFLVCFILLNNNMFIGMKFYYFIPYIVFLENLINYRDNHLPTIILDCPEFAIIDISHIHSSKFQNYIVSFLY